MKDDHSRHKKIPSIPWNIHFPLGWHLILCQSWQVESRELRHGRVSEMVGLTDLFGKTINMCAAFVCACLYKTAYHYCITWTRYLKLLHTVEICKKHLGKCMFNIHTYIYATHESGHMSVRRLGTTINGQRVWVGDVRSIRFLLKSFSVTPCWGNGLRDNQAAGLLCGVNPPQLLKSILRKYEVAQEEQWICLGSFLLLMEEIPEPWKGYCIYLSYLYVHLHSTTL